MTDTDPDPRRLSLSDVLGAHDTNEGVHSMDPQLTIRGRQSDPGPERAERIAKVSESSIARVERGQQIGMGGMGVVHSATQVTLGRSVAIKELREDARTDRNAAMLFAEAFMLGSLEHPNVVPVHDLMLDEHGHPIVVMKRIEGESWGDLIGDDERIRAEYGAEDVLEWHVAVLMKVSNAVGFAHSHGLLHRDLKPDNVMVGRFDEVYLVDWGVAVALRDDGSGRFPLARDIESFAGTPKYMAPEMLGGRAAALTERTDVYLLGATLYHVLVGHPPHEGKNIMEIATNLSVVEPDLPDDVPPRLAEICKRAMARAPEDRYESAEAFRAALLDFSRHRHAVLLADEGDAKLRELLELAALSPSDHEAHRVEMFNTYSQSRFGFRLARRIWPDSEQAKQGLTVATETMIEYLLGGGDVESATTLASQLEGPPRADLAARLKTAKAASQTAKRRLARLENLGRDLDPATGRRARLIAYASLVSLFLVIEATGHFSHPFETHSAFIGSSMALFVAALLVGWVGRAALLSTKLNRQVYGAICVLLLGKVLVHALTAILGHPPWHGHVAAGPVYAATIAMVALTHQPRLFPIAVAFGLAALGGAWLPENRYLFYAIASVLTLLTLFASYRHAVRADTRVI